MAEMKRSKGTTKWFSAQKGFGFIAPDEGGEDLFVHQTSIRSDGFRTLSEGDRVEFSVDYAEDGRSKAVDVSRSAPPPPRGRGVGRGGKECYSCGRTGHLARDCYGHGGGGGRGGGRACYSCGEGGHLARDCQTNRD